jgi:hypothetical protein
VFAKVARGEFCFRTDTTPQTTWNESVQQTNNGDTLASPSPLSKLSSQEFSFNGVLGSWRLGALHDANVLLSFADVLLLWVNQKKHLEGFIEAGRLPFRPGVEE